MMNIPVKMCRNGHIPCADFMGFARLLERLKNLSVSDAAIELGFSSLDHFTRQFRRWMKALPSEYIEGGDAPKAFG